MVTIIEQSFPDSSDEQKLKSEIQANIETANAQRLSEIFPLEMFDPQNQTVCGLERVEQRSSRYPGFESRFHESKKNSLYIGFKNQGFWYSSQKPYDRVNRWFIGGSIREGVNDTGKNIFEFPSLGLSVMKREVNEIETIYVFSGDQNEAFFGVNLINLDLGKDKWERYYYTGINYHSSRYILKGEHKFLTSEYRKGGEYSWDQTIMKEYLVWLKKQGVSDEIINKIYFSEERCANILEQIQIITGIKPTFFAIDDREFRIGI